MKLLIRYIFTNLFIITFIHITPIITQNAATNAERIQQILQQFQSQTCNQDPGLGPMLMRTALSIAEANGVLPEILPALRSILPANQLQDLLQNSVNLQRELLITLPGQQTGTGLILPQLQVQTQTEVCNRNGQLSLLSPNLLSGAVPQTVLPISESLQPSRHVQVDSRNQNDLSSYLSANLSPFSSVQFSQLSNLPISVIASNSNSPVSFSSQNTVSDSSGYSPMQTQNYQVCEALQNAPSAIREIQSAQNVQLNEIAPVLPCTNNAATSPTTKTISQSTVISDENLQLPLNLHITLPPPAIPTPRIAIVSSASGACCCPTPCSQPGSCQAPSQTACSEVPYCPAPPINPMPPIIIESGSGNRDRGFRDLLPILLLALLGNGGGNNGCSSGFGYNGGGGCGCGCNNCGCNGCGCGYPCNCGC